MTSPANWCIAHISSSAPSEQGDGPCPAAGAQRSRRTSDRSARRRVPPALCSPATRPGLPSPSRPVSQRTRNPSNCGQRSVTISNSGAAWLFLHLPGQLCMSMAWGGPGDGSTARSRPAQLAKLKSHWVECPTHAAYWVTQSRAFQCFDFFPTLLDLTVLT